MGVPALFRWLSQKYPKIVSSVVEERPREVDGEEIPVDTTKPNPNGEEQDNLYLDMNGIVHPCSHPEDRPPPATEDEMMQEVFKYTERVVNMVRPRKLLMIAVDGVAPRAKMNQQRARRFRSAQEAKEKDDERVEFLKLLKSQNNGVLPESAAEQAKKKTWDSNAITPGTPFMDLLARSLRYWVAYKLNTDPMWANLKIIISDATVPGEGEHKIMEFIRSQRSSPQHDPNTRHVIYGLDADLIFLGLATHEPHFRVLREDVFFQGSKPRTCRICGQPGHFADECRGEVKQKQGEFDEKGQAVDQKPFIWLHVNILREYLAIEMHPPNQGFKFDLERAIDDWVFMCFFVGNDFLPHLPPLEIRNEGIDTLIAIWRDNAATLGGYITKDGHMDLERVQHILNGLAKQEDAIFKRRREIELKNQEKAKRRKLDNEQRNKRYSAPEKEVNDPNLPGFEAVDLSAMRERDPIVKGKLPGYAGYKSSNHGDEHSATDNIAANKSAAAVLKERLQAQKVAKNRNANSDEVAALFANAPQNGEIEQPDAAATAGKRKRDLVEDTENGTPGRSTPNPTPANQGAKEDGEVVDNIRLWDEGYAERYYEQKFHVDPKDMDFRHKVARAYIEGLAWVLLYYYQGCPSWTWYYPYHYAPFAADFVDVASVEINFKEGKPFRPFEQLMGVMPAASKHVLPEVFHPLMEDEESEIVDFYPVDFPVDLNGKKFAWQGVVILPFIDENRLLEAMEKKYPLLTEEEQERNKMGNDALFFSDKHPLYETVATNFYSKRQGSSELMLTPRMSDGLAGKVMKDPDYIPQSALTYPLSEGTMPDVDEDSSINLYFEIQKSKNVHKSMLLRGVEFPDPALDAMDIENAADRAQHTGRNFGGGGQFRHDRRGGYNGGRGGGRGNSHGSDRGHHDSRANPSNPIAPYLNPSFFPNGMPPMPPPHTVNGPPPPGWMSFPPNPGAFGRGAPLIPPPPPGAAGYPGPPAPHNSRTQPPNGYNYWNGGGYGRGSSR